MMWETRLEFIVTIVRAFIVFKGFLTLLKFGKKVINFNKL